MINIAIDGPSGAGKSTLAKAIAKELGYIYVDTGALYRAIGLYEKNNGIDPKDQKKVSESLDDIVLALRYKDKNQIVELNGKDVSGEIRTPEISMYASAVSAIPNVRKFLLELQRNMARTNNVIMDGRDIGTVILPNADVKIFLTASAEGRAMRRYKELLEKGQKADYEAVLADMKERDHNDATRDVAPAVAAEDAVLIDNSNMSFEETVDYVLNLINSKLEDKKS